MIFFLLIVEQSLEQILRKKTNITPEDVLTLPKITEGNDYIVVIFGMIKS